MREPEVSFIASPVRERKITAATSLQEGELVLPGCSGEQRGLYGFSSLKASGSVGFIWPELSRTELCLDNSK